VTRSGGHADDLGTRLNHAAEEVRATFQPLLQTLNLDEQSAVWGVSRTAVDDAPADNPPAADAPQAE
jgi:hypothetical protein